MTDPNEEPGEAELNAMIRAVAIVNTKKADIDDASLIRFIQDVAYAIEAPRDIAERWGLGDEHGLRAYLSERPPLVKAIAALRAVHESSAGVDDRNKLKASHAVELATPSVANMAMDPNLKPAERMDAFKALQKQAGMDGARAAGKDGVVANAFSVTINLSGRKPITTTVVPLIEGEVA